MEDDKGFEVRDRRSKSPEGGTGGPAHQSDPAPAEKTIPHEPHAAGPVHGNQPPMDFPSLVISLAGSAQMSLGLIPNPETNLTAKDLGAAKQMIDILAMLQDKTKGNLTADEQKLLEQVLFNLRMHFVRVMDESKKTGGK